MKSAPLEPTKEEAAAQVSLWEAEALGAMEKAKTSAEFMVKQLDIAANALTNAGHEDERECCRILDLHRLTIHRLNHLIRVVGEGHRK